MIPMDKAEEPTMFCISFNSAYRTSGRHFANVTYPKLVVESTSKWIKSKLGKHAYSILDRLPSLVELCFYYMVKKNFPYQL